MSTSTIPPPLIAPRPPAPPPLAKLVVLSPREVMFHANRQGKLGTFRYVGQLAKGGMILQSKELQAIVQLQLSGLRMWALHLTLARMGSMAPVLRGDQAFAERELVHPALHGLGVPPRLQSVVAAMVYPFAAPD